MRPSRVFWWELFEAMGRKNAIRSGAAPVRKRIPAEVAVNAPLPHARLYDPPNFSSQCRRGPALYPLATDVVASTARLLVAVVCFERASTIGLATYTEL